MSAQQVWVLQEEADLSRPRGDFREWRPGRVGEACLGAAYLRRLLTEGTPKHTGLKFLLPSQPGALAALTQQGYQVGKSPQSRSYISWPRMPSEPDPPGSSPEGQGHLLR